MRVISKKTLREFWIIHKEAEQPLRTWYSEASRAQWKTPNQIKKDYVKASIISNNRVVFNICGNKYRLIVKINYKRSWVFIRFIGTHEDYSKIDATTI